MNVATERLPGLLAHELRNPLASAMTGAMLARDMVDEGDPRSDVLDGVLRDLDRLTGLLDGWLAIAADQQATQIPLDLEALLQRTARRHRAELVSCPPGLTVRGNEALLARAFDNLCDNARNAGASNVRIAAQRLGDTVQVHVEDDGKGVSPEHVGHIFEPGWSRGGSTGLGLFAVAASLAAGDGEVACVPLTRGTRFTVTLPRPECVGA
ncbi:MAG: HAMP domain-containing sensor histidine kinase [Planctomycetota bacterium]